MQAFSYEENKIKLHDVGHMTKMAAKPIYEPRREKTADQLRRPVFSQRGSYVMNLSKYSPEPLDRLARNFVCSVYIKHIIVCINNAHGLTLTYMT